MGAVYLAERADGEFSQKVAVKLIKRGMDTDFVLSRFRNERQILANLSHPNIVLLLDGGTTDDDLPYFVMDFVEGEPITKYCDELQLNLKQRLELFRQVCEAIDYAHRKKIIHRDLKPSNILVNKNGVPKLLDFGIAKLLDPELSDETLVPTETQMRLMTPEYASPEQVCGGEITPSSDVYSLGVLLYEIATGTRPYKFSTRAPHEVARIICEEEPLSPSLKIKDQRSNFIDRIDSELDKIILKALRKEPSERYETADELSDDITRYLENRPVKAQFFSSVRIMQQPKKKGEQSVAILPFKVFSSAQTLDTGEDEFLGIGLTDALVMRLSSVNRLVVRPTSSVLRYGEIENPFTAGKELGVDFIVEGNIRHVGERISVSVQLLNVVNTATSWAEKFNERFTDVLELEDSISEKVAESLLPHLTGEERRRLEKRGTSNSQAQEAYLRGRYFWNQFTSDSLPKAMRSFQTAIDLDPNYAMAYVGLADFYSWANIYGIMLPEVSLREAEKAARRALELDDTLGEAYAALGLVNSNLRKWDECEKLYKKAIELSPNYPYAREWYSSMLIGTGRAEKGIEQMLFSEQLDPLSLRTMTLVAWSFYQARMFDESIEKARQIIDLDKNYPQGYLQLGNGLAEIGQYDEAVSAVQKCVELMPDSVLPKYELCFALVRANRRDEAREILEDMKKAAASGYVKPYFMAMANAALDERESAFNYFDKAIEEFDPWLLWLGTEAKLDFLHDDPQFQELYRRTDNPMPLKQKIRVKQPTTASEKSIAVLPLKMFGEASSDTDDIFLGIGLADTLITRLSNLRHFAVRPTSSVLRFDNSEIDPFSAGRELNVRYVLDGNYRRIGHRLRITLQLLEVGANSTVWAKQFNEDASDVLALEDKISEQVAEFIVPHLTGEERKNLAKRGTDNIEAHEAYLHGRYHFNTFTEEGFGKAIQAYNKAVALDPEYALAFAGIADYYNWLGVYGVLPAYDSFQMAKHAALKAIELDEELSEAHASLGFAAVGGEYDWAQGEKSCRRALELNPNNALAHVWYSIQLFMEGRFDEGINHARRSLELDPLTPFNSHNLGWGLYFARRFDESVEQYRKTVAEFPLYPLGFYGLSWGLRITGKHKEAIAAAGRALELSDKSPFWRIMWAQTLAAAGRNAEAEEILNEFSELSSERYISPYHIAVTYCLLDNKEKALDYLERSLEVHEAWMTWSAVEPIFDSLRDNERFQELIRRTKNPLVYNEI